MEVVNETFYGICEVQSMDLNAIPVHQENFHCEILDQEIILYFPDGGQFLYLNQTAALVWERCDGSQSINEIIHNLQEHFPEAADEILRDVVDTFESFLKHGCINLS
jgi:hypothetical protein